MLTDLAAVTIHLPAGRADWHTIIADQEVVLVFLRLSTLTVEVNERYDRVLSEILVQGVSIMRGIQEDLGNLNIRH